MQRVARQPAEQQQSLPRRILSAEHRRDAVASASRGNTRGNSVSRVLNKGPYARRRRSAAAELTPPV